MWVFGVGGQFLLEKFPFPSHAARVDFLSELGSIWLHRKKQHPFLPACALLKTLHAVLAASGTSRAPCSTRYIAAGRLVEGGNRGSPEQPSKTELPAPPIGSWESSLGEGH